MYVVDPTRACYDTSFVVMPKDCNYLQNMLFGGELLAQMDLCAAMAIRRTLYIHPDLDTALTVGVNNVQFREGPLLGDLIFLHAYVIKVGIKSITVKVEGRSECKVSGDTSDVCVGEFAFITINHDRIPVKHNLTLQKP